LCLKLIRNPFPGRKTSRTTSQTKQDGQNQPVSHASIPPQFSVRACRRGEVRYNAGHKKEVMSTIEHISAHRPVRRALSPRTIFALLLTAAALALRPPL